jgi:hypothetical protein
MSIATNLADVARTVYGLSRVLGFKRTRIRGRPMGDVAADLVAEGIRHRTLEQQRKPEGGPLPANRGEYGEKKQARGIPIGVGFYPPDQEGGEMLDKENLRGIVGISEDRVRMIYGTNEAVREKAEWFTDGNPANNQPPRPFYDLNPQIEADLGAMAEHAVDQGIRDLGGY